MHLTLSHWSVTIFVSFCIAFNSIIIIIAIIIRIIIIIIIIIIIYHQ